MCYTQITGTAIPSNMRGGVTMDRHPVNSSRIANLGWSDNIMVVQFHNGAIYQYLNVTKQEYLDFLNSPSLGSALSRFDKVHPYRRIQ